MKLMGCIWCSKRICTLNCKTQAIFQFLDAIWVWCPKGRTNGVQLWVTRRTYMTLSCVWYNLTFLSEMLQNFFLPLLHSGKMWTRREWWDHFLSLTSWGKVDSSISSLWGRFISLHSIRPRLTVFNLFFYLILFIYLFVCFGGCVIFWGWHKSVCLCIKHIEYIWQQSNDFCPIRVESRLGFSVDCAGDEFTASSWLGFTDRRWMG